MQHADTGRNVGWEAIEGGDVMAHAETNSRRTENSPASNPTLSGIATLGTRSMEEFAKAQSDLLSAMLDANRRWFDRMQSEAKLASDFTRSVTSCRSIPDAVAACQEWTGRRLELMADDSKHPLSGSQKGMERSARLLSDGLVVNGRDGSSTEPQASPSVAGRERARASTEPASRSDAAWK